MDKRTRLDYEFNREAYSKERLSGRKEETITPAKSFLLYNYLQSNLSLILNTPNALRLVLPLAFP
jgi:hypothetical protein